jgi:hypothetical protein
VKTNLRRWRVAAVTIKARTVVLAVAALGIAGAGATSIALNVASDVAPSSAAASDQLPSFNPAAVSDTASTAGGQPTANEGSSAAPPSTSTDVEPSTPVSTEAWVDHAFELQPTYYYCGPAATRVALSAHGKVFSEDQLAAMLGTTTAGTPSAFDITRVLNEQLGENSYRTVELAQRQVSDDQIAQLKSDIVTTISRGDTLVANVIGNGTDVTGQQRAYPVGHYLNVVGYLDSGDVAEIADSADPNLPNYHIDVANLARWVGSRGYSAAAN